MLKVLGSLGTARRLVVTTVSMLVMIGLVVVTVHWATVRHGTDTCWHTVFEAHCED